MSGGGGEVDFGWGSWWILGVVVGLGGEVGGFFGVVAVFAVALAFVVGGGGTVGVAGGVVDVFDGCSAVGGAAALVAGSHEVAESAG